MSRWINIKDKTPGHHETVYAYTPKGQCVCVFVRTRDMNKALEAAGYPQEKWDESRNPYSFCSQENKGQVLNGVTHWMPLFDAPID